MSQNPSQGVPPEGGDPSESPWQPPVGPDPQHPQSGPGPQSPAPGPPAPGPPPPGWHPPTGGTGPPSGSPQGGQYQGAPQYPGGQGPPYPPPGGPGAYGQYQYGPPPRPNGKHTGLIVGAVIAVGVLIAGVLGVVGFNMLSDGNDEAAPESSASEAPTGEGPTGEGPTAEEPTGDEPARPDVPATSCLPYEPVLAPFGFDLTTGCETPDAFWRITNSSDTTAASVTPEGTLANVQVAIDLCGDDYARLQPGELWKDWYFTYDNATLVVEQLVCVEALGNPDASGRTPIMPDTGDCFDNSDRWWTVPCEQPEALYTVVDTVAVDPPREMTLDEAEAESAPCSGGALFWQIVDAEGRTTHVLCGDELLLA
ncbi:hypothetical protein O1R50_01030 [Glycomyces luteolus]|uniref:Uncharacterized protein n=1 Tax=Glycomyces luteolus TaxID=2670330 RepID=A0A9X3P972_9ACTN|nr:hypothetical protein [Glycomyces luteolus]MDA1358189.1 hypothetical protein [Glycomyces luteolus]